jgi:hypothetical protein
MARLIDCEDPLASMSSTHREIHRLGRAVDRLSHTAFDEGETAAATQELRRTLYALDVILRLHFAQEEQIYYGLAP